MARSQFAAAVMLPAVLFPMILGAGSAVADPEADQLREQLRATVLQLRQLQDQQAATPPPAAAAPSDAASKAKLNALQAQLRAARQQAGKASQLQADLDKLHAQNTTLTAAAATSAAELESLKASYAQSVEAGRALTAERERLRADLVKMTSIATACQAKNTRLVAFTESILKAYGKQTVADVMARDEPFLGLARVRLENLAQDREDTVRAERCDPRLDATEPAKSGGG
jgi:hypothetical protein